MELVSEVVKAFEKQLGRKIELQSKDFSFMLKAVKINGQCDGDGTSTDKATDGTNVMTETTQVNIKYGGKVRFSEAWSQLANVVEGQIILRVRAWVNEVCPVVKRAPGAQYSTLSTTSCNLKCRKSTDCFVSIPSPNGHLFCENPVLGQSKSK